MVKAMTAVTRLGSREIWAAVGELLRAVGFEDGRGWEDEGGSGAAFLTPLGNLELVTGELPFEENENVPDLLIEVGHLDQVRGIALHWSEQHRSFRSGISECRETRWNSRLFTLSVGLQTEEKAELKLAFWEYDNPVHGKPAAIEGDLYAMGMRFGIVVARWNAVITDRLLQGALDGLVRSGAARGDITIVRVPGAWEIPSAARMLGSSDGIDAVITLGCLLRGETAHYEAIYNEVARGIGQSQQETGVPHMFGVLTCETLEQALDRAGVKHGNKGFEAAVAAVEMVSIKRRLSENAGAQAVRQ